MKLLFKLFNKNISMIEEADDGDEILLKTVYDTLKAFKMDRQ